MKTQYTKELTWDGRPSYERISSSYYRPIKTFAEIRDREAMRTEHGELFQKLTRGCRNYRFLNAYNDFSRARNYGRSWKDYTRQKKQWG